MQVSYQLKQLADKARSPAREEQPSLSDSVNASVAVVEESSAHDAEVDASMSARDAATSRPLKPVLGGHTPHYEPSAVMRNISLQKLLRMSQNVPGSPS